VQEVQSGNCFAQARKKRIAQRKAVRDDAAAGMAVAPSDLPRGWREYKNTESGEVHYSNTYTDETTNIKPTLPAPPRGWELRAHEEHGHYFYHPATNISQWHHPHDTKSQESGTSSTDSSTNSSTVSIGTAVQQHQAAPASATAAAAPSVLPRGWFATQSKQHGVLYYTNAHTKKTTWEVPTLPASPEDWSVHLHAEHGLYYKHRTSGEKKWEHPLDGKTGY
jgi:hypothetical protein